jgi:hypothetical protein
VANSSNNIPRPLSLRAWYPDFYIQKAAAVLPHEILSIIYLFLAAVPKPGYVGINHAYFRCVYERINHAYFRCLYEPNEWKRPLLFKNGRPLYLKSNPWYYRVIPRKDLTTFARWGPSEIEALANNEFVVWNYV